MRMNKDGSLLLSGGSANSQLDYRDKVFAIGKLWLRIMIETGLTFDELPAPEEVKDWRLRDQRPSDPADEIRPAVSIHPQHRLVPNFLSIHAAASARRTQK